jgi:glutamyl/glutaminyl-tRNA synthetase
MSKRFAETSLLGYREAGYLPEALLNFISLIGWHPKDDVEILSAEELIKKFELERMQKAGAVFDEKKLNWMNAQYIKNIPTEELLSMLKPLLTKDGLVVEEALLLKIIDLERGRAETLSGLIKDASFFFHLPEYDSSLLIWKNGTSEKTKENLEQLQELLQTVSEEKLTKDYLEDLLMPVAVTAGKGDFLWPFRVALSGLTASPGPFEIAETLGKDEVLKRIKLALAKL